MTTDSQSTGASASFVCEQCGKTFTLPAATLARYPSWKPRACMQCRDAAAGGAARASKSACKPQAARSASRSTRTGAPFSTAEVLARFDAGPTTGVFTDGSCSGNPGPGGWGAVRVVDGRIVEERYGSDPDTTNNRMELTAMAEGLAMIPAGEQAEVYSDSRLVVQTLTGWAAGWERRGWKRADGEVTWCNARMRWRRRGRRRVFNGSGRTTDHDGTSTPTRSPRHTCGPRPEYVRRQRVVAEVD